jgi:ubiquinone/menaquinone biosynthesis C-methylase UbiE
MNHDDHVRLIEGSIERGSGGVWADFGAGTGAFTLALRDVAGPAVEIIAIDDDQGSLHSLRRSMERHFPGTRLNIRHDDFSRPLQLPPLDGIVAANAIHYVRDQVALLQRWQGYLKPEGRLIVVEYDTDAGNRWVPHPLSFGTFGKVAMAAGFSEPALIGTHPSRFLGGFYAALTVPA